MNITSKAQMYAMLQSGAFGNTMPQWFNIDQWESEAKPYDFWGVRSLTPGGPCRLYCPIAEVRSTIQTPEFIKAGYNLSMMIDAIVGIRLWAEVVDTTSGLIVYGIEYPPKGGSWRELMPTQAKTWSGVAAMMILRKHLNETSFDDLMELRDLYPNHVYEFSATDQCIGRIPHRNICMWEVRNY